MLKQTLLKQIVQERESKRRIAQQRADENIEKLKMSNNKFKDIYLKYNLANLSYIKAKHTYSTALNSLKSSVENFETSSNFYINSYSGGQENFGGQSNFENLESENLDNLGLTAGELKVLKDDMEDKKEKFLQVESEYFDFLKENHISIKSLLPKYDCQICQDKGIVNGKMCSCLIDDLNSKLAEVNSSYSRFNTFEMANSNLMNEGYTKIYKEMFDWCNEQPNEIININLMGGVGTGKTFLLECIASQLLKNKKDVIFTTAFNFNEECRKYHFSQPNKLEEYLNCSYLVIDDLGTEPNIKNITQEYLYNVVNLRQVNRKTTLISTNLSPEQLVDRYGMRTVSRLTNKQLSKAYLLTGIDKRSK